MTASRERVLSLAGFFYVTAARKSEHRYRSRLRGEGFRAVTAKASYQLKKPLARSRR